MPAEAHGRRPWLVLGIVVLLIPLSHLVRFSTQRSDIWWTPEALAVPLADSGDRVEIYVRGRRLQEHLTAQRLQVLTEQGPVTLGAGDVTLRFNNWDRVRAGQMPLLLAAALATGVVGGLVVLIAAGLWPPSRRPGDAGEEIADLVTRLIAAWNRRDPVAFGRLFTPSAVYVSGRGELHCGRKAIEGLVERADAGSEVSLRGRPSIVWTGRGAVVEFGWVSSDRGNERRGLIACVVCERDGDWLIERLQNDEAQASSDQGRPAGG